MKGKSLLNSTWGVKNWGENIWIKRSSWDDK